MRRDLAISPNASGRVLAARAGGRAALFSWPAFVAARRALDRMGRARRAACVVQRVQRMGSQALVDAAARRYIENSQENLAGDRAAVFSLEV